MFSRLRYEKENAKSEMLLMKIKSFSVSPAHIHTFNHNPRHLNVPTDKKEKVNF